MKNLTLRLSFVTLALMITIVACKKDNDSPGESAKFSATINGTAYQPNLVAAVYDAGYINIAGLQILSNDTLALDIDIPDTAHVNVTIPFEDGGVYFAKIKSNVSYYSYYSPSHGSTTITSWDKSSKKIAGTFSGVVYNWDGDDSIVVTNGKFNTTYVE